MQLVIIIHQLLNYIIRLVMVLQAAVVGQLMLVEDVQESMVAVPGTALVQLLAVRELKPGPVMIPVVVRHKLRVRVVR